MWHIPSAREEEKIDPEDALYFLEKCKEDPRLRSIFRKINNPDVCTHCFRKVKQDFLLLCKDHARMTVCLSCFDDRRTCVYCGDEFCHLLSPSDFGKVCQECSKEKGKYDVFVLLLCAHKMADQTLLHHSFLPKDIFKEIIKYTGLKSKLWWMLPFMKEVLSYKYETSMMESLILSQRKEDIIRLRFGGEKKRSLLQQLIYMRKPDDLVIRVMESCFNDVDSVNILNADKKNALYEYVQALPCDRHHKEVSPLFYKLLNFGCRPGLTRLGMIETGAVFYCNGRHSLKKYEEIMREYGESDEEDDETKKETKRLKMEKDLFKDF